jgi:hypothetical protein
MSLLRVAPARRWTSSKRPFPGSTYHRPSASRTLKARGPTFARNLSLAWTGCVPNLLDADERDKVIGRLHGVAERFRAEHGVPLRLVVVDTVAIQPTITSAKVSWRCRFC